MTVKVLRTRKDYNAALVRFEKIFHAKPGTAQSDEADVLAVLIRQYEDKYFFIQSPTPLDAVKYRMEQQGLNNQDLVKILGFKSRVTDLFKNRRKLSLNMIRRLHDQLQIPLETLIQEY